MVEVNDVIAIEGAGQSEVAPWRRKAVAYGPALVLPAGGLALIAPRFSFSVALFAAAVNGFVLAFLAFVLLTDRWRDRYWIWACGVLTFDASCLFFATTAWRLLGGAAWSAAVLGSILLGGIAVGHLFRRRIMQELFAPQTRVGMGVAAIGTVGGASVGALTFAAGRIVGLTVVAFVMLLAVLFLLVVMHATWLKVEDPSWERRRRRGRRRR